MRRNSRGTLFRPALLAIVAIPLFAAWPEFRGPDGQGHSEARNVPLAWNAESNVVWKTEVPGRGWSSPVIVDGKIFLTTALTESSAISLRALSLDEATGALLWNTKVLEAGPAASKQVHGKNTLASPTPILRNGRLYVHFGHLGTAALDLGGKVVWTQTNLTFAPVHGNGGSPALAGDLLVFSCDGAENPYMAALDVQTGKVRWKTARKSPARNKFSFSTPLLIQVEGQPILVSPASGFVGGYDSQDGKELWRVRYGEGYSVVPRPVFGNGLVYLSSGFDRPVLYAIDPKGARGDATDSQIRWKQAKGAPTTPSPLVAGSELYMVSDAGIASCLDAHTGEIQWSERLGGNFSASPVFAGNRLYFVNEAGVTFVVGAGRKFQLLATNDLGERSLASPALDEGAIFIRTEAHLWRLGQMNK